MTITPALSIVSVSHRAMGQPGDNQGTAAGQPRDKSFLGGGLVVEFDRYAW